MSLLTVNAESFLGTWRQCSDKRRIIMIKCTTQTMMEIPFKVGSDFGNQKEKIEGLLNVLSRCYEFKGVTLL